MEKSCGALIYRVSGGKRLYLLLHYDEGHWDFPKGHVEAGEGEEQTARREIEEETGILQLEFAAGFREAIQYSFRRGGAFVPKQVVFFLAETKEERVRLSDEHIGFEWMEYASAKKRATYRNAKSLLEKSEAFLSSSEKPL